MGHDTGDAQLLEHTPAMLHALCQLKKILADAANCLMHNLELSLTLDESLKSGRRVLHICIPYLKV